MSSTASATPSTTSPASTVNVNARTPWTQYYCNANTSCPVEGTTCHYNKYCIPELAPGTTCKDDKDESMVPFVARVDNVYTLFCDMPDDIKTQTTKCPLGCESWETCHGDVCYLKKCTKDQTACKNGQLDMCMGLTRDQIICYEAIPHGNSEAKIESKGLSSSQIGGIAGGVSAAVLIALAAGAFFMVRRRRANKAKATAAAAAASSSASSLPTYYAQDEKRQIPESA